MKSMAKTMLFFAFIFVVNASYGQMNDSQAFVFSVWGRGTVNQQRAVFRWDNNRTLLQSRDNITMSFYNEAPAPSNISEFFRFDRDLSFNIQRNLSGGTGIFNIRTGSNNDRFWLGTQSNHMLTIGTGGRGFVNFLPDRCAIFYKSGNDAAALNISATNRARYALFVEGGILSEDFALGPRSSWADFVFEKDYELAPLSQVEAYITENKRLPDMPSASEVQQDGYGLHELNVKLLQKIEELTLYIIEQGKEINDLKKLIEK